MRSIISLAAVLLPLVSSQAVVTPPTSAPDDSQTTAAPVAGLAPVSYSRPFVYTTPTTQWSAPTFATPTSTPIQTCSDYATLCSGSPSQNGQECQDSMGAVYGIICDNRFSGTVITSFGKREVGKRINVKTLDDCLGFCDQYDMANCLGSDYQGGTCMNYAAFFGTIPAVGRMAFVRQSQGTGVGMGM